MMGPGIDRLSATRGVVGRTPQMEATDQEPTMSNMPTFFIDPAVGKAVPDFVRHLVFVDLDGPLDVAVASDAIRRATTEAQAAIPDLSALAAEPSIQAWREAFAAVGLDPDTHRPAAEALLRRAVQGKDLELGSALVNIGNAVAITHRLPIGVHDVTDLVHAEVALRPARTGDRFIALDGTPADPDPGEIVLVAGDQVLTRRWVWRQGLVGSFSADSRSLVINVDLVEGRDPGALEQLRGLLHRAGAQITGELALPAVTADPLLADLRARGVVNDCTSISGLSTAMASGISLYCGIDPTAPSLHVGSLLVFATLRRFRAAGHRPIVVVGGATGFIGDPSGRASERALLDHETLDSNKAAMRPQIERLLLSDGEAGGAENPLPSPLIVDNRDWTVGVGVLDFLRDVGKHFRVGEMLGRDSVRSRLGSEQGMSFTEFSYSLLQAFDFQILRAEQDCVLQVGGSDQWGNIVAGVDLIRRTIGLDAFGLTWPLLTKANGEKFGKSADSNVWLDPERTSVWTFWQFWMNQADDDVASLLRSLSARPLAEIEALLVDHAHDPGARVAQRALADEMTAWVHGLGALGPVHRSAGVLFGGTTPLDAEVVKLLTSEVPTVHVADDELGGMDVLQLLITAGAATSRSAATRLIEAGGASVNGQRVYDSGLDVRAFVRSGALLIQRGRRNHYLVVVAPNPACQDTAVTVGQASTASVDGVDSPGGSG